MTPLQVAAPELVTRYMVATFYINPGKAEYTKFAQEWEDRLWKQGMVYGYHTMTHKGANDVDEARREISECTKVILKMVPGRAPRLISWGMPGQTAAPLYPIQSGEEPRFELRPNENYFQIDGRPTFVLARNPAGMTPQAYDDHFRHAAAAGERFMRIHFTYSPPSEKAGEVDAAMLMAWDAILDPAEP